MSELVHYADVPMTFDRSRVYEQHEPFGHLKPVGFWVSVPGEDDWPSWCRQEEFCLDGLTCAHRVRLRREANILQIDTPQGIDTLHATYAVETDFDRKMGYRWDYDRRQYWALDWRKVTADYDGLIIAPYQWTRRLNGPSWYYGFDCASGCIWNTEAVESVELVYAMEGN